ncbi:MAG: 16S rRNA (cytosine(1402)-N(4))-methyltransferase RsmH [Candidatus Omnitrophota bacterium]
MNQTIHIPVMLKEVLDYLDPKPGDCLVDGTMGTGGHALEILKRIGSKGCLIGIDRDLDSLTIAQERLKEFSGSCHFVHQDFRQIDNILQDFGIENVNGMLFDLGISSYQLSNPVRGFSLQADGPLDMRMDQNSYISAYDLVNSLSEKEIALILKAFGQERWSYRIAHYLVAQRARSPIASTQELTNSVLKAIPHAQRHQRIHPATRTFQAFRIAVNRELEALEIALDKCFVYLKKGARLCVISFHSLEDRIVKEKFRTLSRAHQAKLITKKPLRATEEEISENPRSRSARLRVIERI